ncbi:MAG TPA: hypothetical protein DIU15_17185 [Deltaproteobacteria bacterium]|nr:hypothetical protein [Deltaproteobacteria bacterium]HCP47778.1 hypothetical protein [Deltaproteobacteria bacterium]
MTMLAFLPTLAGLWMLLWVALYWAYTLLGAEFIAPWLGARRRTAFSAGLVLLSVGILFVRQTRGVEGLLDPGTVIPSFLGLLCFFYARKNQWLVPRPAAQLVADQSGATVCDLVAVLANGHAVPLAVMRRARTAVTSDLLIVHCGLSRSLAAFHRPQQERPAAILPHPTGFTVGVDGRRWDGVDGRASVGETDLQPRWIGLCSQAAWRDRHPHGELLVPEGAGPGGLTRADRTPLVPGARSVDDPSCWGRVSDGRWLALSDADLERCPAPQPGSSPTRYIARWAATQRNLKLGDGTPGAPSDSATPPSSTTASEQD